MNITDYLAQVAHVQPSSIEGDDGSIYLSKFDNSYITRVGMEDDVEFLAELEITGDLTQGVGYSPLHNKWFGWSHRACYGFTIGSTCEKGDCHYTPKTVEDFLEYLLSSWMYSDKNNVRGYVKGTVIFLEWDTVEFDDHADLLTCSSKAHFTEEEYKLGKGEWVAKTMEDAKQMAIDFADGVS